MSDKTTSARVMEIFKMCKNHFGSIHSVEVKYHNKKGWLAKAQFDGDFQNLTAEGESDTEALKKLKKRVSKIIQRYNEV